LASPAAGVLSSVLVLIAHNPQKGSEELLLTKRTQTVDTHKGQISFPGGVFEEEDGSLLKTALRESEEEVGVLEKDVEFLGSLSPVSTPMGFQIFPHVAKFNMPYSFTINEREVERILFLPIADLIQRGLKTIDVNIQDRTIKSAGIYIEKDLVWGATARMLSELLKYLKA
jgi:8-oxo-dGTP pyrophosphatase MutT (NUDIX family)